MSVIHEIGKVLGDRVVVQRLERPETVRGLHVPESYKKDKEQGSVWWGRIVKFGLDTNVKEAYNLSEGDIIGIEPLASSCHTVTVEGSDYVWVPQEFICAKDDGEIAARYAGCLN